MITRERALELLEYNPDTGQLYRKRPRRLVGTPHRGHSARIVLCLDYKVHIAHRIIWLMWYGEWPSQEIDHINGNGLDNRICNLRLATRSQNASNQTRKRGAKGVSLHGDKWRARITVGQKTKHIGYFPTQEQAQEAYRRASPIYHGEFARKGP